MTIQRKPDPMLRVLVAVVAVCAVVNAGIALWVFFR
jgi:hypothetical protein